jgi:hypothetical protein
MLLDPADRWIPATSAGMTVPAVALRFIHIDIP